MKHLLGFFMFAWIKILSHVFYRAKFTWISATPEDPWERAKLIVLLNHTSLYEPLYIQAFSFRYLWRLAKFVNVPGADVTLRRPIVGRFWKLMMPNIAAVSRRKDSTWSTYLQSIRKDSIIMIAPEGRMKRPNGLDKNGRPMTVQGGIADILEGMSDGGMVLCFSAGLHHVQKPGQLIPNFFRNLRMNLCYLDIDDYKKNFPGSPRERKLRIIEDLQQRLQRDCPQIE